MSTDTERNREFCHCEICYWICLCHCVDRGGTQQPSSKIERVPKTIKLCSGCYERSIELWERFGRKT